MSALGSFMRLESAREEHQMVIPESGNKSVASRITAPILSTQQATTLRLFA